MNKRNERTDALIFLTGIIMGCILAYIVKMALVTAGITLEVM